MRKQIQVQKETRGKRDVKPVRVVVETREIETRETRTRAVRAD